MSLLRLFVLVLGILGFFYSYSNAQVIYDPTTNTYRFVGDGIESGTTTTATGTTTTAPGTTTTAPGTTTTAPGTTTTATGTTTTATGTTTTATGTTTTATGTTTTAPGTTTATGSLLSGALLTSGSLQDTFDQLAFMSGTSYQVLNQVLNSLQFTHIPEKLTDLRRVAVEGFMLIDAAEKRLQDLYMGSGSISQQRSLLMCLDLAPGPSGPTVDQQFAKLRSEILDRVTTVVAHLMAFDQKRTMGTIAKESIEDLLGQKELDATISLLKSSIPILLQSYEQNLTLLLKNQDEVLKQAFAHSNLDVDRLIARHRIIQQIEADYGRLLSAISDNNVHTQAHISNITQLSQQVTRFHLEQYAMNMRMEMQTFVGLDSIGKMAVQKNLESFMQETQQLFAEHAQKTLAPYFPAAKLDAINADLAQLRALYLPRGILSCSELVKDDGIDRLGPRLQLMIRSALQDVETTRVNDMSDADWAVAKGTFLEAMKTFMDNDIMRGRYKNHVSQLAQTAQTFGGLLAVGAKPSTPHPLDLVKKTLLQQYLQYLAQNKISDYRVLFNRTQQRVVALQTTLSGDDLKLLSIIQDGLAYVQRFYLDQ